MEQRLLEPVHRQGGGRAGAAALPDPGGQSLVLGLYRAGCELRCRCAIRTGNRQLHLRGHFPPCATTTAATRDQVYTLRSCPALIAEFGLPQIVNPDGIHGPRRYIEAQLWDDTPIRAYLGEGQKHNT
jgi:hypothetical protein